MSDSKNVVDFTHIGARYAYVAIHYHVHNSERKLNSNEYLRLNIFLEKMQQKKKFIDESDGL